MAASVREQIVAALATSLAQMSIANGYENDYPGGVRRFERDGQALQVVPKVVVTLVSDQQNHASTQIVTGRLDVAIEVFAARSEDAGESTGTYIDSLASDVERCIGADTEVGGLATHAVVDQVRPLGLADGAPYVGVVVKVSVTYRHARGNPTAVA